MNHQCITQKLDVVIELFKKNYLFLFFFKNKDIYQ